MSAAAPSFDDAFLAKFECLLRWRRDVRRFKPDPLSPDLLDDLMQLAALAPSVGLSQPWRFVSVDDPARRAGQAQLSFRRPYADGGDGSGCFGARRAVSR